MLKEIDDLQKEVARLMAENAALREEICEGRKQSLDTNVSHTSGEITQAKQSTISTDLNSVDRSTPFTPNESQTWNQHTSTSPLDCLVGDAWLIKL